MQGSSKCCHHWHKWDSFYTKINKEESKATIGVAASAAHHAIKHQASIDIKYVSVWVMFCDQHRSMGTHLIASLCNFLAAPETRVSTKNANVSVIVASSTILHYIYSFACAADSIYHCPCLFFTIIMVWCVVSNIQIDSSHTGCFARGVSIFVTRDARPTFLFNLPKLLISSQLRLLE